MKRVKTQALREGVTLKAWFVSHLSEDLEKGEAPPVKDAGARFRKRFEGLFEPSDINSFKRAGRA